MLILRFIVGLGLLALVGCAAALPVLIESAPSLIASGESLLANYKATPDPNDAVVAEAQKLLAAANAANVTYGATSSQALSAAAALNDFLATAAPGDGVTPASVPVS